MTRGGRVANVGSTPSFPQVRSHHHDLAQPLFAVPSAVLGRVRTWSVESQQGARRNAMVANTALAARRAERQDVDAYFAAPGAREPAGAAPPGTVVQRAGRADTRSTPPAGHGTTRPPAESSHADLCGAGRARAEHRLPRRAVRRRHPPHRVDQRPGRDHRRTHRACSATGSGPGRGPGRRCCGPTAASGSCPGTTAAPAARTVRLTRRHCGIEAFVEDALSVMDHFGIDRAPVMGWSMGVNTMFELAFRHPERVSGLFAVAGVPGDTFATMLAPFKLPRLVAHELTVNIARVLRLTGRAITPVTTRLPVGPAHHRGAHPQRLHAPGARPRGRRQRRARVPRDPHRVVHAPRHRHLRARPGLAEQDQGADGVRGRQVGRAGRLARHGLRGRADPRTRRTSSWAAATSSRWSSRRRSTSCCWSSSAGSPDAPPRPRGRRAASCSRRAARRAATR